MHLSMDTLTLVPTQALFLFYYAEHHWFSIYTALNVCTLPPPYSLQHQLDNPEHHGLLLAHAHKHPPKTTSHGGMDHSNMRNKGAAKASGTAGVAAESTYSQGNSGVAVLGANVSMSPEATITPLDFLSEHFQVRDFIFK